MSERTCYTDGCNRQHRSRGFCALHYYQWQRSGRPWPERRLKRCLHCGSQFTERHTAHAYCSRRCVQSSWKKRTREQHQTITRRRECVRCGEEFDPRRPNQKHCSKKCTRRDAKRRYGAKLRGCEIPLVQTCVICGDAFKPFSLSARYCSQACRNQSYYQLRRNRRQIRRVVIFERDEWECQICASPIDRSLRHPHPWSPTIDHIVPLVRGGSDEPSNLQAAHMTCNASKGDRWR